MVRACGIRSDISRRCDRILCARFLAAGISCLCSGMDEPFLCARLHRTLYGYAAYGGTRLAKSQEESVSKYYFEKYDEISGEADGQ